MPYERFPFAKSVFVSLLDIFFSFPSFHTRAYVYWTVCACMCTQTYIEAYTHQGGVTKLNTGYKMYV